MAYPYPWLEPGLVWEGVTLASPEDICAMKISAIGQRGSKKDFFDLAELLKVFSLNEMLELFGRRYPKANRMHYLQSLTYFADAEDDLPPELMPGAPDWKAVKSLIQKTVAETVLKA